MRAVVSRVSRSLVRAENVRGSMIYATCLNLLCDYTVELQGAKKVCSIETPQAWRLSE